MLKKFLKKIFPGVSWQHPVINAVFRLIDPFDYLWRVFAGLTELPKYSIRVRSNGVNGQFGGRNFRQFGHLVSDLLTKHANLGPSSRVLEIGCGCGRNAIALAPAIKTGQYFGVDIEPLSLLACTDNKFFADKNFSFQILNIQNDEYNKDGAHSASQFKFDFQDNSFDVIFLISVFTHMTTKDVKNYIAEISRMLKPGGTCMFSSILVDHGTTYRSISFPFKSEDHYFYDQNMPEICIGYKLDFFISEFSSHHMKLVEAPLWGSWRNSPSVESRTGFSQDIVFFRKSTH